MSRFFNTLRERVNWKHCLKTAIAAAISLVLVRALKLPQGFWACVSAIVVMQSETAATLAASLDRLVGTALGALLGWIAAEVWGSDHLLTYTVTVLLCMLLPAVIGLKSAGAGRMAGVTASIVLLVPSSDSYSRLALTRFLEVSLGIVVALVVSHVTSDDARA
jgi:uncharacterized membrane protein YgaE (UPF0421/DUF939 family)